jgi:hypothetical protein
MPPSEPRPGPALPPKPRRIPLPARLGGLAIPVIAAGVALATLYAAGVWVPWSPWTVDVQEVDWVWLAGNWPVTAQSAGFSVYGGSHVAASLGGPPGGPFVNICGAPGCSLTTACLLSISAGTPGFAVLGDDLQRGNGTWELSTIVATPSGNFAGSLTIDLRFGDCGPPRGTFFDAEATPV